MLDQMDTSLNLSANKFWRVPSLNDLELSYACYAQRSFPRHTHEEYIIGVMVEGAEKIAYRGTGYLAPAGSVLLLNPGEPHANYSIDGHRFAYRTFYPSLELLKRTVFDITDSEHKSLWFRDPVVQNKEMAHLLLRLHQTLEQRTSGFEQESSFISVIATLVQQQAGICLPTPTKNSEKRHVQRVREYLEANFRHNVSLSQLSALTGISPYYLLRAFRKTVGLPPLEYQLHLRILSAKKMLRQGYPIAEVALETGFVDQSHFTRHFKKIVGFTPRQFVAKSKIVQDNCFKTT